MKELILFRGLPGSGKTTLAKILVDVVFSADDYFTDSDGNYLFNQYHIREAHALCQYNVEQAMEGLSRSKIGVANTFTQDWEMNPYFSLAAKYGYRIHSIIVENRHGSSDVHGVPTETKDKMRQRFHVSL